MKIDEFEFRNKQGQEIEPTKNQLVIYIKSLHKEIKELKQQLAEKEKEKNKMICHIGYDNLKYLMANNDWQILEAHQVKEYNQLRKANQDKISFAIAELEKVKGLIANHTQELWTCENDDIDVVLYEEIDNQINELKELK